MEFTARVQKRWRCTRTPTSSGMWWGQSICEPLAVSSPCGWMCGLLTTYLLGQEQVVIVVTRRVSSLSRLGVNDDVISACWGFLRCKMSDRNSQSVSYAFKLRSDWQGDLYCICFDFLRCLFFSDILYSYVIPRNLLTDITDNYNILHQDSYPLIFQDVHHFHSVSV